MRARLPALLLLLAACGPPVQAKVLRPILEVGYPGKNGEPPPVPYTMDFGPVQAGTMPGKSGDSLTESLRIANVGTAVLRLDPINVDGNGFKVQSPARWLLPGEQIRVDVIFAPTSENTFDTSFVVTSNDSATSVGKVHLLGEGYSCGMLQSVLPLDFGWVAPDGKTTEKTFTFRTTFANGRSPSGCMATYELQQEAGGPFAITSLTPSSAEHEVELQAAGELNVVATFRPSDFKQAKASLILRYAGDNSIATSIDLTGNSGPPSPYTLVEVVPTQPDLSVLAVIDSSPAMMDLGSWALEHVRAAALEEAGVRHVQVGITSTGIGRDPSCTDALQGGADGRLLPIPGSFRIFPIPIREDLMESATAVGACHATPRGLQAMELALSPALLGTADDPLHDEPDDGSLGFLPDGSDLRIVLISASEDQSPGQPGDFATFIRDLRKDRRVSVRAVLGGSVSCKDHGQRYDEFASGLGGEVEDLCAPSVHDRTGQDPPYVIKLPKVVLGNLQVLVDDQPLTVGADYVVTGRTDSPELSQVEILRYKLEPDELLFPLPGAEIKIIYDAPGI